MTCIPGTPELAQFKECIMTPRQNQSCPLRREWDPKGAPNGKNPTGNTGHTVTLRETVKLMFICDYFMYL